MPPAPGAVSPLRPLVHYGGLDTTEILMRKRPALIAAALVACTLAPARAAADAGPGAEPEAIIAANRQVFIGAGGQRLQYTETLDDHFADSDIGKQAAAIAGAVWEGDVLGVHDAYVQGQVTYARGKTAYTGFVFSLQNPGVEFPYDSSTDDETTDWQLRLGKGLGNPAEGGMLTPFIGFGAHRWVRDSSRTDPYGYLEVYKHESVVAGVLGQVRFAPHWVGGLELNGGSSLRAELGAPSLGLSTTLRNQRVLGGALSVDYAPWRLLHIKAEYRDTSFRYGRSGVSTAQRLFEPDSSTYQGTAFLMIGLGF